MTMTINEKYDSIQSLFSSPEFKDSNVYTILVQFKRDGGEIVNEGTFGIILSRPEWKYVLKLFVKDDSYLRFVRFVLKNPRPSYPKFYDIPRRIKTNFLSTNDDTKLYRIDNLYVVPIEKLFPIDYDEYADIRFYFSYYVDNYKMKYGTDMTSQLKKIEKKYPRMKQFNEDFLYVIRGIHQRKNTDLKLNNIMKRADGQFVIIDPIFDYTTSKLF